MLIIDVESPVSPLRPAPPRYPQVDRRVVQELQMGAQAHSGRSVAMESSFGSGRAVCAWWMALQISRTSNSSQF